MVLTGSSGNGALLGWELSPLRQSAKLWLHDAGITHVHELVRIREDCLARSSVLLRHKDPVDSMWTNCNRTFFLSGLFIFRAMEYVRSVLLQILFSFARVTPLFVRGVICSRRHTELFLFADARLSAVFDEQMSQPFQRNPAHFVINVCP